MRFLCLFILGSASSFATESIKKTEMICDVLGHDNISAQIDVYVPKNERLASHLLVTLTESGESTSHTLQRYGTTFPVYSDTNDEYALRPWMDEGADYPTFRTPKTRYEFYCHTYNRF